jgi:hypothetical protein
MEQYYKARRLPVARKDSSVTPGLESLTVSEYDLHRITLLTDDVEEGWAAELRRYLGTMQGEVEKNTDIVEWWQVSFIDIRLSLYFLN